ncbi:MAG: LytTR family DNA-binding domain-containing protein [Defluviitaleaceae bacterium]|nr:LytTR family DNA-binding domain-containing protein [Defluviitaleaceae bacterium]
MLKVAICDDEHWQIDILAGYITALAGTYPNMEYHVYRSGLDLSEHYQRAQVEDFYDIIFLDVEMGNCNGLDIAAKIRETDNRVLIAYITKHEKFMHDCFETYPISYLIKPVAQEKFNALFERAYKKLHEKRDTFCFRHQHDWVRLFTDNIIYFDCYKRKTVIYTTDKTYEYYETAKDVYARLNKDKFVMVHNSYIINMAHILELEREWVRLQDEEGTVLPVSGKRSKEVKDTFLSFNMREGDE